MFANDQILTLLSQIKSSCQELWNGYVANAQPDSFIVVLNSTSQWKDDACQEIIKFINSKCQLLFGNYKYKISYSVLNKNILRTVGSIGSSEFQQLSEAQFLIEQELTLLPQNKFSFIYGHQETKKLLPEIRHLLPEIEIETHDTVQGV